jgi:hypothetical protein
MSNPLVNRIPFAKILLGFTLVFVISLGMCGLTGVSTWQGGKIPPGMNRFLEQTVGYDIEFMFLSAVGLVLTILVWVVMTIVNSFVHRKS